MKYALLFIAFLSFLPNKILAQTANDNQLLARYTTSYGEILQRKYLNERESLVIPEELKADLKTIATLYKTNLQRLENENDSGMGSIVIPYYQNYPDVGAILLNRNGQFRSIKDEEKQKNNGLLTNFWKKIPNKLFDEVSTITDQLRRDKFRLTVPHDYERFRNFNDDNLRKRDDVINFLLWQNAE